MNMERKVMPKPFAANRRVIALEIENLLRIRRTMARVTLELEAGLPPEGLINTGAGRLMPRHMLLAYARLAFANGMKNVGMARKVLFRLSQASANVPGAARIEGPAVREGSLNMGPRASSDNVA